MCVQDDIDTSVWSPDVQSYTRMFYARYGRGDPGKTPWRLGRGLNPLASPGFKSLQQDDAAAADTDTFMTKAHMDLQARLPQTSVVLWQQYCSEELVEVDLEFVRRWAVAMRPRSIHDLKPMLMLCQGLLRDFADLYLAKERAMTDVNEQRIADAQATFAAQAQVRARVQPRSLHLHGVGRALHLLRLGNTVSWPLALIEHLIFNSAGLNANARAPVRCHTAVNR